MIVKKVFGGVELEICSSQDKCLKPLRYDDIQPS